MVLRFPRSYTAIVRASAESLPLRENSRLTDLLTTLKSVSSMKLHRDLDVTQKTAWHLAHRIRKRSEPDWNGPVLRP